eukprot:gene14613-4318_t
MTMTTPSTEIDLLKSELQRLKKVGGAKQETHARIIEQRNQLHFRANNLSDAMGPVVNSLLGNSEVGESGNSDYALQANTMIGRERFLRDLED